MKKFFTIVFVFLGILIMGPIIIGPIPLIGFIIEHIPFIGSISLFIGISILAIIFFKEFMERPKNHTDIYHTPTAKNSKEPAPKAPVLAGDFNKGFEAYQKGDYATAMREFLPLAQKGNTTAQHNLGVMYRIGQGVQQDYSQAFNWYSLAAKNGYAQSQANLGVMYANGLGVNKDYFSALIWLNLALLSGNENGTELREQVLESMHPEKIAEAERVTQDWLAHFNSLPTHTHTTDQVQS